MPDTVRKLIKKLRFRTVSGICRQGVTQALAMVLTRL